jgi:hypothetical protein
MFVRSIINDVGGAWVEQWSGANTPKQVSLTDATFGRMLTTGSFALGGNTSATALADFNAAVPTGFWGTNANTQNLPATISNNGSSVLCVRLDSNDAFLTAYSRAAGAVNTFIRRERDGVWSDTFLQYNQSNIVGTVSQTAGTPTGAIIQRGSNANGQFARFADGTQICFAERNAAGNASLPFGNIFWTGSANWTFPIEFSARPAVSVSETTGAGACWGGLGDVGATTTSTSYAVFRATGIAAVPVASLTAIGRWFN